MKGTKVYYVALAGVSSLFLTGSILLALQRRAPNYDPSTETTLKGVVEKVEEVKPAERPGRLGGTHLVVKSEGKSYEIHVGPSAFLQEKNWKFAEGDQIEITGSKVNLNGEEVVLARTIKKDDRTLTLRDEKGIPVWSRGNRT